MHACSLVRLTAAPLLCAALGACVEVEFDRMSTVPFPSDQMIGGQTYGIASVFLDAGILVSVDEDDTGIPALPIPGNECITDAELDALEASHRQAPLFPTGNVYHLYAVVVDHHGEVLDSCVPDWVTGKLLDTHTRSALAFFHAHSSIENDPQAFLRTTLHEIGHALNLHHEDRDAANRTIMTQSSSLADDWVYAFSAQAETHLELHPNTCKMPGAVGGAPFTWVVAEHGAWHPGSSEVYDCN